MGVVTIVGDAVIDHIYRTERIPAGGTSVIGRFGRHFGGKGLNRAVAAARLGLHVRLISAVGDDENGHRILGYLDAQHIDTDLVTVVTGAATPVAAVIVDRSGAMGTIGRQDRRLGPSQTLLRTGAASTALASSDAVLLNFEQPMPVIEQVLTIIGATTMRPCLIVEPSPPIDTPESFHRHLGAIDYLVGTPWQLGTLLFEPRQTTGVAEPRQSGGRTEPRQPGGRTEPRRPGGRTEPRQPGGSTDHPQSNGPDFDTDIAPRLRALGAPHICAVEQLACRVRSATMNLDIPRSPGATRIEVPGSVAAFAAALAYRLVTYGRNAQLPDFAWAAAAMEAIHAIGGLPDTMPTLADVDRVLARSGGP